MQPTGAVEPRKAMSSGVLTVPNAFTLVRLLCLPLFLYVLFTLDEPATAAWLLGGLAATDWVDGYLARRLGQVSEFGKIFDPTVDRLLFIVAVTAIVVYGSMPVWVALVILVREVAVGAMMVVATFVYHMPRIDVAYLGKVATALLMFAVPGFLLADSDFRFADVIAVATWLLTIPGLALSIYTGLAYIPKVRAGIADAHAAAAAR